MKFTNHKRISTAMAVPNPLQYTTFDEYQMKDVRRRDWSEIGPKSYFTFFLLFAKPSPPALPRLACLRQPAAVLG